MRRARHAALALFLVLLLLGPARAEDKLRVGKAIQNSFTFGMLDVGIGSGVYKANGLAIAPVTFSGAARVQQALTSNDIDIGLSTGQDMGFILKGLPAMTVGAISNKPTETDMLVRADSPIKALADLKGKKVAVSNIRGYPSWLTIELSRHEGWGNDGMILVATGSQPASIAALKTGQVDAWAGDIGTSLQMAQEKEGRILVNFGDVVPPFMNTAVYATNILIAQHPDLLRRFLKAWFENIAWARAHRPETVALLLPILNLKPEIVGEIYDRLMPTESPDGRFDPVAMKTMPRAIVELGILDTEPDVTKLYTEAFLPRS
ncbi:MAG TPA: ABC transporter substrate-binding protein [Stellaceae bacterium]|jgi:ABC-type nitrate/sulfonate/bicarbonate transport system substrate-binding protein